MENGELDLGNYSSWMSLPIEVQTLNIKKIYNDMKEYESEIMRKILSYQNELNEINDELVVRRLIGDGYHSTHMCSTAWDDVNDLGLKYSATYHYIVVLKTQGIQPVIEENLIVDLNFQAQFNFFQTRRKYRTLWSYLPNIFVGTAETLRRIFSIICSVVDEPILHFCWYNKWLSPNRTLKPIRDSELSTDLGSYSTWISLPIEVKNQKFLNIKKVFNDLSEFEAQIMRRILTYRNELNEKDNNYELCNQLVLGRLIGDGYHSACICSTAWDGVDTLGWKYSATYNYICLLKRLQGVEPVIEERLIVDLDFRAHFTVFQPTTRYKTVWSYLPNIFVGTEKKLRKIISVICSVMDEPIPPLMKSDFLYNKWLSPNHKLTSINR